MTSQRASRRQTGRYDQHEQPDLDEATDPVLVDRRRWSEGGWSNETGMAAFMSVLRLQQDLVAAAHQTLSKYDLSITEHAAMIHLAFSPGNRETLGRIAEQLLIGAGRCNYVIKDLESKGLVRRRPHPSDGRVTFAILTAKGSKVVAACSEAQARNNFGFGDLDPEELDHLVAVLTRARLASARKYAGNKPAAAAESIAPPPGSSSADRPDSTTPSVDTAGNNGAWIGVRGSQAP